MMTLSSGKIISKKCLAILTQAFCLFLLAWVVFVFFAFVVLGFASSVLIKRLVVKNSSPE